MSEYNKKMNQILDSISDKMTYLFDRWQDEKEYEDWDDYKVEIEKVVKSIEGMQLVTVFRPDINPDFGFIGCYEEQNIKVLCTDIGGDTGLRITLEEID